MSYKMRFVRLAVAVSMAGAISGQIPMSGGTAMADGYTIGGDSSDSSSKTVVEAGVGALVLYGLYSVVSGSGSGGAGAASGPVATGGSDATAVVPPYGDNPVWDVTNQNADLQDFAVATDDAGLKDQLRDPGKYTVFTPTLAAFTSLSQPSFSDLQTAQNKSTLSNLMQNHIVAGQRYTIADLKKLPGAQVDPGAPLMTLASTTLYIRYTAGATASDQGTLAVSSSPFSPTNTGVPITQTDIQASNGVIHPIGQVLPMPAAAAPVAPAAPVVAPAAP